MDRGTVGPTLTWGPPIYRSGFGNAVLNRLLCWWVRLRCGPVYCVIQRSPRAGRGVHEPRRPVQHLGDQAVKRWLPITAQTPREVHTGYPCMQPLTFTVNTVLPPAAAINRDSTIAPTASLLLVVGLPIVKLALWAGRSRRRSQIPMFGISISFCGPVGRCSITPVRRVPSSSRRAS